MAVKVVGIVYGRDDAPHLQQSLQSMLDQSYPLHNIIYVDDGSEDNSVVIAQQLGVDVIALKTRHESWAGTPNLSHLPNIGINALPMDTDYFLINGADIILDTDYVETLLGYMMQNPRLVLLSGIITKEPWTPLIPKGAGRLHRYHFWKQHIQQHPLIHAWESYPIYQALAQGYETMCLPVTSMHALRRTRRCKQQWGHAMRELGYWWPIVVMRCFRNLLSRGVKGWSCLLMLLTYLLSPKHLYNQKVTKYLRQMQHDAFQRRQLQTREYPSVFCDRLIAVLPTRMVLCGKHSLRWRSQLDCRDCSRNRAQR